MKPSLANMIDHPIATQINKADQAINQEDFDTLTEIYSDDAVLVVKPGVTAIGKTQIREAFVAIAAHFEHSLQVRQAGMEILESHDTALVLAKSIVVANNHPQEQRLATYVFKKVCGSGWLCVIDNSYGHGLLDATGH